MTTLASPTDADLVAAVRRGRDDAFRDLYNRYRPSIHRYVERHVGDSSRAEDVTQDVFLSALRQLRRGEPPVSFRPWLYEIAKNACVDEYRRRRRRPSEVPLDEGEPATLSAAAVRVRPPEAAVDEKQRLSDLQDAFDGLVPRHHRVMVMRELEGLSTRQIGQRLGMSQPEVESTLFRARRRLGSEYEELRSGRRCGGVQALIAAVQHEPDAELGIRQRAKLARHLKHCQVCRRVARQAGLNESFFSVPSLPSRIAALLPLPWLSRGSLSARGIKPPVRLSARSASALAATGDPAATLTVSRILGSAAAVAALAAVGGGIAVGPGNPAHAPTATAASTHGGGMLSAVAVRVTAPGALARSLDGRVSSGLPAHRYQGGRPAAAAQSHRSRPSTRNPSVPGPDAPGHTSAAQPADASGPSNSPGRAAASSPLSTPLSSPPQVRLPGLPPPGLVQVPVPPPSGILSGAGQIPSVPSVPALPAGAQPASPSALLQGHPSRH